MCSQSAEERVPVEVVHERPLTVDLDDGQPLPVARLELGVAADVDLLVLEVVLLPSLYERAPRTLAQMTAVRVKQRHANGYGYSPLVVVASATRWTAKPYAARRMLTSRLVCTCHVSSNALSTIPFSFALTSSSFQKYS